MKPTIDISADGEYAFIMACHHGHLNIAQWLFQIKPTINISAYNEDAFRFACSNGYLNVAQWLLQIKPTIDISALDEYAFTESCYKRELKVAQWLVSLRPDKYKIILNNDGSIKYDNNRSISYEIIKSLNIVGIKHVFETETCPICCVSDCDVITCCNHSYCTTCISSWLHANNSSCPTCRNDIGNTEFKRLV